MNIDYAANCAAARNFNSDSKVAIIADAEREMGAFLSAVRRKFGPATVRRAAGYWVEAFDSATWPYGQMAAGWRRITIAAASRLAQEKPSNQGLTPMTPIEPI